MGSESCSSEFRRKRATPQNTPSPEPRRSCLVRIICWRPQTLLRFLARGPMCCHRATTHATSTRAPPPAFALPLLHSRAASHAPNPKFAFIVRTTYARQVFAPGTRRCRCALYRRLDDDDAPNPPLAHNINRPAACLPRLLAHARGRGRGDAGRLPARDGGSSTSRMITGLPLTVPTDPATAKTPWIIRWVDRQLLLLGLPSSPID